MTKHSDKQTYNKKTIMKKGYKLYSLQSAKLHSYQKSYRVVENNIGSPKI